MKLLKYLGIGLLFTLVTGCNDANANVLVSSEVSPRELSTIQDSAIVGEQLTIDLEASLEEIDEYPGDNYQLNEQLVVNGSGDALANTQTNTITYTALGQGITNVRYVMEEINGVDLVTGIIEIAVSSNSVNTPPKAEDFEGPTVNRLEEAIIDVALSISDDDGDSLQLTDVYAANDVTVKPFVHDNPQEHFNNTKFTFITKDSNASGIRDVSYYITDHRGGYVSAIVRVFVNSERVWGDIVLDDTETYTAPWDKQSADSENVNYQVTQLETVFVNGADANFEIALFSHAKAEASCNQFDMVLPTEEQLSHLFLTFNNNGDPIQDSDGNHWPVGANYWTSDETISVNLSNGVVDQSTDPASSLIITCVSSGTFEEIVMTEEDAIYPLEDGDVVQSHNTHLVEATILNDDGEPLADTNVYSILPQDSPLVVTPSNGKTDQDGKIIFSVTSNQSGSFDAALSYRNKRVNVVLNYVENAMNSL